MQPTSPHCVGLLKHTVGLAVVLVCAPGAYCAGEVLRNEPRLYTEVIAPLMTPLEKALKSEPKDLEEHAAGITLLDERIVAVADDGRAMRVHNIVRKTLTEAGSHWNAEETFVYRRKEQQFYVLRADTIQPDGTVQSVKSDAILVNSPQRQAQFALYDDLIEVRVIFPNVKPGCITHIVVITEDLKARMPGEYAESLEWSSSWPKGRIHFVADVSGTIAKRMRIQTIGTEVPVVSREELPGGNVRYSFDQRDIPPLADENRPAPAAQVGPSIHFSSIQAWADVGRWFVSLLKDRDLLTPALALKVDEWTKGLSAQDAILGVLFDKVANEVRYAGLELGESDYRPHECNAVWDNQYGDCKDKANLLVAFLRHKGIPAYMTFVNATDLGLIDRRAPDFHVFSHAIVALPDGRGGYRFCDPTIARGRPGLLSPADSDRDVLVVTDNSSEWGHTPAQGAGQLGFHFDLELKPTGELAGWLEITADGFYGASEDEAFHRLDRDESLRAAGQAARNFYPGAEVIDVENKPRENPAARFILRAYMTIPRGLEHGSGRQELTFPRTKDFFDYLGFTSSRKTPFFIYRGRIIVSATVKLPAGMAAGEIPAPFDVDTPAGPIRARWEVSPNASSSEMMFENLQSVLSPDEFKAYYEAVQSLEAWLDKPVSFSLSNTPSTFSSSEVALQDFPRMPSGPGQLALVNSRYPEGSNPALRKAALEKTLQYFPGDKATVFQASVLLASLELVTGKAKDAAAHLDVLLSAYRTEVSPQLLDWGRWVHAVVLHGAGQDAAATEESLEVAGDASAPGGLRARCALVAAEILRKTEPDKALAALDRVLRASSDVQPDLYAMMAHVLLREKRVPELQRRLKELVQAQPAALDNFFSRIARDSRGWTDPGDEALQTELFGLVREVLPNLGPGLVSALSDARADREGGQAFSRMQTRLAEAFARKPLAELLKDRGGFGGRSDEDFDLAIRNASSGGDLERCVQLSVQAVLTLPVGPAFPMRWSRAVAIADYKERTLGHAGDDGVLAALLDACDDMPRSQSAYWSGQLILAERMERRKELVDLKLRLEGMLGDKSMPEQSRAPVLVLYAKSLEETGDYEGALRVYSSIEPYASAAPANAGALLRSVFLYLDSDRPTEAIRVIQILEAVDPDVITKADGAAQIREFIALHRSGTIPDFWKRRQKWWPEWKGFSIYADGDETAVPVISSKAEWGARIGAALRAGDASSFYSELRRGMGAARWLPSFAADLSPFETIVGQMSIDTGEYRILLIHILEGEQDELGDPANRRERELCLAANRLDNADPNGAIEVVEDFLKGPRVDDVTNRTMNIVWGASELAVSKPSEDCVKAIQRDLEGSPLSGNFDNPGLFRAREVVVLAGLMGATGHHAEMRILLDNEKRNPRIANDSAARSMVESMYRFAGVAQGDETPDTRSAEGGAADDSPPTRLQPDLQRDPSAQARMTARAEESRDEQIAILDKRIAEHGDNAASFFVRGSLRLEKSDLEGAIADLTTAVTLDPSYSHAFDKRGIARIKKGDFEGAIADFNSSIRLNRFSSEAFRGRADARMLQSRFDLALADYDKAIELDPVDALAYQGRGDCRTRRGDATGASVDFASAARFGVLRGAGTGGAAK